MTNDKVGNREILGIYPHNILPLTYQFTDSWLEQTPIKFCQSHLTSTLKDCKVFMRLTSLLKRRVIWARESKESIFDPWSWVSAHLVWSLKREPTQLKLLAKIFGKYLRFSVSTISIHLQTCWTTNSGECIGPTWKLECFWKFSNLVSNN